MEFVLRGVSAYVEVWSANRTENYSKTFAQQLRDMGAQVSKTFNKHVTHVVFKEGHLATWRKAQQTGVKLVSILWVEKCRETGVRVDESLFPALYASEGLPLHIKKHKCMQPKDFIEKTPENDRRLQRRLDEMAKELDIQKNTSDIPVLLFEDDGSLVYSPVNKLKEQCNAMERRIKDMKDKRENLSPTASQMTPVSTFNSKWPENGPFLGLTSSADTLSPEEQISDSLNSSFDDLWGNCKLKKQKMESLECIHVAQSDIYVSTPALEDSSFSNNDRENLTPKQCNRKQLNKKLILQHSLGGDLSEKGESETSPNKKQNYDDNLTSASIVTNSSFLQERDLSYSAPSQRIVQLEAAAGTKDSHSDLLVSSKDFNMCSVGVSVPVNLRGCAVGPKSKGKSKRKRSSTKLTTSVLCKSGSENEFLEAMTTRNKISHSEEGLYEDFFSSSDLNKSEIQGSHFLLGVQQKSSSSPEVICKAGYSRRESNEQCSALSKKKRKTVQKNDTLLKSDCKLSELPESTKSITLNCMVDGKNAQTAEDLVSSSLNQLHQNTREKNCRTNVNCSLYPSEATLQDDNTAVMVSLSLKSEEKGTVEPKEHPHIFPDSANMEKSTGDKKETLLKKCSPSVENEISVCDARCGSREVFNAKQNKHNGELKNTGRSKKPTRTLVMTSMSSEKQNTVIQVVNKLGGFSFSNDVCETTSHVVAGSPRRTLNVMLGIARRCWIVCYEWVLWSLEFGCWISEEPYELSASFPAAPICRLQRHLSTEKYQQDLFKNQPVMFISLTSQPPCDKLSELVRLCGGKVCKTLRQAKICIGEYLGKQQPEIKYLSEKWILDSVTQHKICPLENYIFQ
ncbi:microcephalin isoform X1 [Alligator sinensis]|uniref:Microcephalin n=1 Tax=Alligator sinensis TaxID=38654 RepID=A0A1U7RJJ9_ALLSI|nr:microcephalin isoform X1 [Alligator sinensis]